MSANCTNDSSNQQNGTCESLEALFPVRMTKIAVLSITDFVVQLSWKLAPYHHGLQAKRAKEDS